MNSAKYSLTAINQEWSPSSSKLLVLFLVSFTFGILWLSWLSFKISPEYWPIGVDVYPRWVGTRAFWNGQSPYSTSVDQQTQNFLYGRHAFPGEDTFGYYYPAYASVILAPLIILPVEYAAIIWSSLMFAILVSVVVFFTLTQPYRLSLVPWAVLVLSGILFRPALLSVLNGQYGLFVLGCWSFSWWMCQRHRYLLSGSLLALSMIKPSLAVIPVSIVVLWSLLKGRTKIVQGFFYTFLVMLIISIARIGWWVPRFLSELSEYSRSLGTWTTQDIITTPGVLWLLFSMILIALGCFEFKNRQDFPISLFFGGLFLNLVLTPHTLEYDLVILLLPLLFLSTILGGSVLGYFYVLFLLWVPWLSWVIFMIKGIPIDVWWKAIWVFYPILISGTLIFVEVYYRRRNRDQLRDY